jgi:hypothetical protein
MDFREIKIIDEKLIIESEGIETKIEVISGKTDTDTRWKRWDRFSRFTGRHINSWIDRSFKDGSMMTEMIPRSPIYDLSSYELSNYISRARIN